MTLVAFVNDMFTSATIDVGSIAFTNAAIEKLRPRLRVP